MKNKIFIDIGNTNFKILKNKKFFVQKVNKINIFLSKLSKNNSYFFSCNNVEIYKLIKKLSIKNKNIILIKNDFFNDLIHFKNDININDVGIDILLQIYWFIYILNKENGIILSLGTYLTCVSIYKKKVISINISSGLSKEINELEKIIKTKIKKKKYSNLGFDNYSAIFSSFLLKIFGLINYNKTLVESNNVIFTGLGFDEDILMFIKNNFSIEFDYVQNITLESLKKIYF